MKKAQPKKQGDFFYRIFLLMTLMVIIMTVCSSCLLFYVRGSINRARLQEQDSYISVYADYMENLFQNIGNTLTHIESDPETLKVLLPGYHEGYDYFKSQNNVTSSLSRFSTMSGEIKEIYLYPLYHDELLYTVEGTISPKVYYNNRFQSGYGDWVAGLRQNYPRMSVRMNDNPLRTDTAIQTEPSRLCLYKSVKSGNRILGTVVVSLEDKLVEQLFSGRDLAQERSIYIVDSERRALSGNTRADSQEIFAAVNWDKLEETGQYGDSFGIYSCRSSHIVDVQYLVFTPNEVILGWGGHFFQIAYLVLAAIFAALLVLAYSMSRRLYRPLRSIVDVLRDIQSTTDESGENGKDRESELERIRKKILDVVSVNHSLRTAIQDSSPVMLEAVLLRLICTGPYAGEPFSSSDLYRIRFEEGNYNIFVVRADLPSSGEEQFYMEYYDSFNKVLEQCLAECLITQVSTRVDEYVVLVYSRDGESASVLESFCAIHEELMKLIPHSEFYIACGRWTDNILNLRTCYGQAVAALRRRGVNSPWGILCPQAGSARSVRIPNDLEMELNRQLSNGRQEQTIRYVSELLERCRRENVSVEDYLLICNTVNNFVLRYINFHTARQQELLIEIDETACFYGVDRLKELVLSNLEMAFEILAKPEGNRNTVILQVLQYVDDHFNKDINLSIVADKLGYTPNYLSRYFKQAKGINFTDYLNRKKVEYAKVLLTTTNKTIKHVTGDAGFNSAALFIKTFEKYEGVTPGEFKKLKNKI